MDETEIEIIMVIKMKRVMYIFMTSTSIGWRKERVTRNENNSDMDMRT